ncbi:hypothetical protein [Aulosira sp. FACHB-615]|uniref:hypothetical protein n=1 Tax=Aulosira sp. FACHB-615 TaxID=2692777 RepID=UPI0016888433|nr:hypothetical protein [Aulosira sp. FACHB-615]MBD2492534.1 hypothetical protein [Aulosira sp. FACHB-615]
MYIKTLKNLSDRTVHQEQLFLKIAEHPERSPAISGTIVPQFRNKKRSSDHDDPGANTLKTFEGKGLEFSRLKREN